MPPSISPSTLEKFITFGDLLRYLRRRVGLTQMEMAIAVGYSNTHICRLEQNQRLPDIPTIEARFISTLGLEEEPRAVARLLELASHVRQEDAPAAGLSPYKGLNYYDETDADLFVGREVLTSRLVERVVWMVGRRSSPDRRFLAVVGASGSGKSSIVRAGLVSALRWNEASTNWHFHVLTPTAHPLESLASILIRETNSVIAIASLMDDMARDTRSLQIFARRKLGSKNGSHLLLIVDQFEELFSLCRSEEERASFIGNLLTASSDVDGPVILVITLRADFYAHCANYVKLREALAQNQEYIGAMSDQELRRAIDEPARRGRWEFEPGLVDLLLHDVGHEPGALPLLSHALFETWQRRRGRLMTLSGYASSGGVRGAIAETAETVFNDQFTLEQQAIARRIFLRLTELNNETAADTRRRATFKELILKPEEASPTREVLQALADARLITTTEDSAEVAHEALIREWPTLQGWLEENRDGLRLHRQLTEAAQEWLEMDRAPDILYRGARLAQAQEWSLTHGDEINALERDFLEASLQEKEAQQSAELARKKHEVLLERKARIFLRSLVFVLIFVTFGSLILMWTARRQANIVQARELVLLADESLEADPERSILLALQSLRTAYSLEAEDALHRALQSSRVRLTLPGHIGGARTVDVSPDGNTIATASFTWQVTLWETASGKKLFTVPGSIARYSPDGNYLAVGREGGTVTIWDLVTRSEVRTLEGHRHAINEIQFHPDGKLLVSSSLDNTYIVWNQETGEQIFSERAGLLDSRLPNNVAFSADGTVLVSLDRMEFESQVSFRRVGGDWSLLEQQKSNNQMFMSPNGRWLVSTLDGGAPDNAMILWDLSQVSLKSLDFSTLKPRVVPLAHKSSITNLAFSKDGSMLASVSQDGLAKVWRLTGYGPNQLMILSGHTGALTDVAFHPGGTRLATASEDGTVRLWDITPFGSTEWFTFEAHTKEAHRMSLTENGRYLATASLDGVAKLWDLESGEEVLEITGHGGPLFGVAISPDGTLLATGGFDNLAKIWKLDLSPGRATSELVHTMDGHGEGTPVGGLFPGLTSVVFSPDGTKLATGGADGMANIWDVETGKKLSSVQAHPDDLGITNLAFSPDSRLLAMASDGTESGLNSLAKIWEVKTGKEISTFTGHIKTDFIWALSFSPDGERVATGSVNTLKIWEAKNGRELQNLDGHTYLVVGADFSPDGKYLATSSTDDTVRIWDLSTGDTLRTYTSPTGDFYDIEFMPDGKRFIVTGQNFVYGYVFDREELIRFAHSRLTRWFTLEECRRYLHQEECPLPPQ